MNNLPFLICLLFLISCAGTKNSPNQELLSKYKIQIGCTNYGILRIAPGDHTEVLEKLNEDVKKIDITEDPSTAIVYRGINKDILFIHLVYRNINSTNSRKIINYLFNKKDNFIIGYYQCNQ